MQAIGREAREFGLGETRYYIVVIACAVLNQCFFLGTVGAIFYGSALLAGVVITALLPVTEVFAVVFFSEPFLSGKGVALGLSLWGFISYFYGEMKAKKARENVNGTT
jgi:Purine nucleobase transmembrane transport